MGGNAHELKNTILLAHRARLFLYLMEQTDILFLLWEVFIPVFDPMNKICSTGNKYSSA